VPLSGVNPNYRILRAPRLLSGEEPVNLPDKVGIDFNSYTLTGNAGPFVTQALSKAPNTGTDTNGNPYYEILFSPSGAVIGQGTPNGFVYLWVRDMTADPVAANDVNVGFSTIVSVQTRTGLIASQPVGPSTPTGYDPYLFTRDAKNSGT
jgi:hypothetical protein